MIHLTLLPRVYGPHRQYLTSWLLSEITNLTSSLDASITNTGSDKRGHLKLKIEGSDGEFARNLLEEEYGSVLNLNDLVVDVVIGGHLIDVGKFGYGLYVDVGIVKPHIIDALVPLYCLRDQFNMQKTPLRTIVKSVILTENLPVEVKLTKIDKKYTKIEAEIAESFTQRIENWMDDDHERLIVLGVTPKRLEDVLSQTGHKEDIYRIEKLGLFEYSLRCKRTTRATGILSAIGPRLKGIPMHLFIPTEVEAMIHAKA